MKTILKLLSLASATMAAGADFPFDYATANGADWKDIPNVIKMDKNGNPTDPIEILKKNYCNPENHMGLNEQFNQSPIDLRNDWPSKNAGFDNFQKTYQNVTPLTD